MKGTNTHPVDAEDRHGNEPAHGELEEISKSQLKRDSKALQDLGKKLVALNSDQLARIPLDTKLSDAITLAHKLSNKRGALKRHFQYIGKLLRSTNAEPIMQAVDHIEADHANSVQALRMLEQWRERILREGDPAIQDYCAQHQAADRQQIRQIFRNHAQASEDKKTRFARLLFKALRDTQ